MVPIAPITPTDPRPIGAPGSPLGRSGLDLADLLDTPDTVTSRAQTAPVALEVGLEQARGALIRNLASDALSALDSVWEGARRTEEGWYLRSGALTLLGLPGESERVAEAGLESRPASSALRFLQSLSRLAVGDLAGARAALAPALERAPDDPLLLVQQAVLLARQGDGRGAEALLQRATRSAPEHPALGYGRAAVRTATADVTRSVSRNTPDTVDVFPSPTADIEGDQTSGESPRDVVGSAVAGIGARLVSGSTGDVARGARLLLRAFSAGGTLASAGGPEQSYAARALLTVLVGAVSPERTSTPTPVGALVHQIVAALRDGRSADAERLSRKAGTVTPETTTRMLQLLVRGATDELVRNGRGGERSAVLTPPSLETVVRGEAEPGAVVPVRLGLALLEETPASRSLDRVAESGAWLAVSGGLNGRGIPIIRGDEITGSYVTVPGVEAITHGWAAVELTAATRTGAATVDEAGDDMKAGSGVRAVALICVGLAGAAMTTGHSAVAIALGLGAAWLALRRSGSEGRLLPPDDPADGQRMDPESYSRR